MKILLAGRCRQIKKYYLVNSYITSNKYVLTDSTVSVLTLAFEPLYSACVGISDCLKLTESHNTHDFRIQEAQLVLKVLCKISR